MSEEEEEMRRVGVRAGDGREDARPLDRPPGLSTAWSLGDVCGRDACSD